MTKKELGKLLNTTKVALEVAESDKEDFAKLTYIIQKYGYKIVITREFST